MKAPTWTGYIKDIIFILICVKMPTFVGILTFMRRKNSIVGLSEPEKKAEFLVICIRMSI